MKILRFLFENFIDDSENFDDLNVPKINCINGYFIDNSICVCNEGFTTSDEIKINEDGSINKCDILIKESNNNNENYEKKRNFLSFILKILPFFLIAIVFLLIFIKIWMKCKKNKKNSNKNNNKNKNNNNKNKNNFDEIESTSRNFNYSNNNLNKKNFNNNNKQNKNIQRKIYYNNNNKKVLFKTPEKK
jgi:large-conductance mechanosensitive channel